MTELRYSMAPDLVDLGPVRFVSSGETWYSGSKYKSLRLAVKDNDLLILSSATGLSVRVLLNGVELKEPSDL